MYKLIVGLLCLATLNTLTTLTTSYKKIGPFLPGRDESYCEKYYYSRIDDTWDTVGKKFSIRPKVLAFVNGFLPSSDIPFHTKLCVDGWY